jgi:hypothetical protein
MSKFPDEETRGDPFAPGTFLASDPFSRSKSKRFWLFFSKAIIKALFLVISRSSILTPLLDQELHDVFVVPESS